jgi:uncharacterized protein YkwD
MRIVILLGALLALTTTIESMPAAARDCWDYTRRDRRVARRVNRSRLNHGDGRLRLDRHLSRVARSHTRAMINNYTLYHTPNLSYKITRERAVAENVGYGSRVKRVHRAFMRSSGHRANTLGSYRFFGVSARRGKGYVWLTVVFESRRNPGTRLSMPRC